MNESQHKIVLFKSSDGEVSLPVAFGADTVWLTQSQMAQLFGKSQSVISRHINNAIREKEIDSSSYAKNAYPEENASGIVKTDIYNLDVVISVGYRVHSLRGVEFRKWATSIIKDYIINGIAINRKRLHQLGQAVELMKRVSNSLDVDQVLDVVSTYSAALDLLDAYDHQTHRGGALPLLPSPQQTHLPQGWYEAHRRPHPRRPHGDDRRIKASRKGNDGQPRHDVPGGLRKKTTFNLFTERN